MGRIIGLTGFAQSGKDTAAGFLIELGYKRLAFADILRQSIYNLNPYAVLEDGFDYKPELIRVRDLVDRMGWDQVKVVHPEIRELLQRMGTEVGRDLFGENFWVERVMAQIDPEDNYVITDVRFPNEAEAIRQEGGLIFRISRPGTGAVNPHASEAHVMGMEVDGVIVNNGDLATFASRVLKVTGA